jgi:hypothetical protein
MRCTRNEKARPMIHVVTRFELILVNYDRTNVVAERGLHTEAPAGGATAAAPEGGTLACPSVFTSLCTRWALVTL